MTRGAFRVMTHCLALGLACAAGCAGRRAVPYRLPGTVLVPAATAGIEDRSGDYGPIFCRVLEETAGGQGSWGSCSEYLETPGLPAADLPPLPADLRVLVVPGFLGQCLSPEVQAFGDALDHLREAHGLRAEYLDVPAMGSCGRNASIIADHLRRGFAAGAGKWIVVGYSKGGCDLMTALADHPDTREMVAALVTVAAPVGGSRVPDLIPRCLTRLLESDEKLGRCDKGDAGGLESLRRPVRQRFLAEHPVPYVPTYSLVAVSDRESTSRLLRPFWRRLSRTSLDQDGQVIASEGVPPGARFLGVARGDHWAVAMPADRSSHRFLRHLADRNRYPRAALLEAALRLVAGDLAPRPPAASKDTAPPPAAREDPPWFWAGLEILGSHHVPRAEIEKLIPIPVGEPYHLGDAPFWSGWCADVERTFDFTSVECGDRPLRVFDGRKAWLVVDIVEKGREDRLVFRAAPAGSVPFASDEMVRILEELGGKTMKAAIDGHAYSERADKGYLEYVDETGRNEELGPQVEALARLVPPHRGNLLEILRREKDPARRRQAANLLNWAGGDLDRLLRRTLPLLDDPDAGVRNNLSRFMVQFVGRVGSVRLRRRMIDAFVAEIERPSHGDRNKGLYNLLAIARAWPEGIDHLERRGRESIRYLADNSVLFNVKGPAAELLALIDGAERRPEPGGR